MPYIKNAVRASGMWTLAPRVAPAVMLGLALGVLPHQRLAAQRALDARSAVVSASREASLPTAPSATLPSARADRRTVIRSALIGGAIGGVAAAVATFAMIENTDREYGIDGVYYSILVPMGVGVGLVVGALVGSAR